MAVIHTAFFDLPTQPSGGADVSHTYREFRSSPASQSSSIKTQEAVANRVLGHTYRCNNDIKIVQNIPQIETSNIK